MNNLYEKSLRTLELDRVLAMLAEQAVCDEAKQLCLSLRPSTDLEQVRGRLQETQEARRMIGTKGGPSFSGIIDVGAALMRAEMGGSLNMKELLDVAGLLRTARLSRAYAEEMNVSGEYVSGLFMQLQANKYLEEKIFTSILSPEEMADAASPELGDIRRQIRSANSRVRETLQKIITSPAYAKFLQDPIITIRSDRYVVPVKAECRGDVNGLVHDMSSSGATYFIEPMQVVALNNELRELAAKEHREIERILAAFSAETADHAQDILRDYQILVQLDVIFAKGKLTYQMDAAMPELSADGRLILKNARHPLLDAKTAVPVSVRLGEEFDTLIITGPNTGGKTVTLKTMGLLVLMTECGLHIPVTDGSRVPVFTKILADIGDEQSIEQSLSTFSSHLKNIVGILEQADAGSLVLFDELGAGTDPVEGAALAMAIIGRARELGARVAATTHYAELKIFAMTTSGVENASCEFDVETLRPTYKLLIGIPGRSNAFAISSRLGLSDSVIEQAKGLVDSGSAQFEDVLAQLDLKRQAMERELLNAQILRRQTEAESQKAGKYLAEIEKERQKAVERARAEAGRILEEARSVSQSVFAELDEMRRRQADDSDWQRINDARAQIRQKINRAQQAGAVEEKPHREPAPSRPLKAGDTVELTRIGASATVVSPPDKDGNLVLQAGIMKITARLDEVRLVEAPKKEKTQPRVYQPSCQSRAVSAKSELDLRGMAGDEAVLELEQYIDGAVLSNLNTVSVIHGKGTGALRAAVQAALKLNPSVKSFRLGRYGEGETGVTIVELK